MRPIFTVHAGEYLVGSYIEKHIRNCEVWLPSKDTGIDLLVTNRHSRKQVGIQVKFSKDFLVTNMSPSFRKGLTACGWWTLDRNKLKQSRATFWIFVLYSFDKREPQFVIVRPKVLLKQLTAIHGSDKRVSVYFWVTNMKQCWETRDLSADDQQLIVNHTYTSSKRNFTRFLGNWASIKSGI